MKSLTARGLSRDVDKQHLDPCSSLVPLRTAGTCQAPLLEEFYSCSLLIHQPFAFLSQSAARALLDFGRTLEFLAKIFQYEWKFQLPGNRLIFCLGPSSFKNAICLLKLQLPQRSQKVCVAKCVPGGFLTRHEK